MEKPLLDEVVLLDAGTLITLDCYYGLLEIRSRKPGTEIHVPKLVLEKEYIPPKEKAEYKEAYSKVYIKEVRAIEDDDTKVFDRFYNKIWPKVGKSPVRERKNRGEAWALSLGIRLIELGFCSKVVFITSEKVPSRERFRAIAEEMGCPAGRFMVEGIDYLLELIR